MSHEGRFEIKHCTSCQDKYIRIVSGNAEVDINPKDELEFLKVSKGLMATISITNRTSSLIAFKIKATTPGNTNSN